MCSRCQCEFTHMKQIIYKSLAALIVKYWQTHFNTLNIHSLIQYNFENYMSHIKWWKPYKSGETRANFMKWASVEWNRECQ